MVQSKLNKIMELSSHYKFYFLSSLAIPLLLYTVLINAWVGDDAQITFRQVWNFLSGDGITFNYMQRVQAFTHPLWFWIVSLFGFITQEIFATTVAISVGFTILGVLLLVMIEFSQKNNNSLMYVSTIVFLPFSWAFIDYSTSGLENPLSYFLVGLLLYLMNKSEFHKNLQNLFLILSLLVLNRLDYMILFLPLAFYLMVNIRSIKEFIHAIWPGALLILSWFLFSTFYFGFPLPNTYYAKLNAGYPINEILIRGWDYLMSMNKDINSIFIIISAIILTIISRSKILICLSIGQLLYIGYIVQAGGDFMLGRFFAILVFLSVGQIILSFSLIKNWSFATKNNLKIAMLFIVIIVGLFQRFPFLFSVNNPESRAPFTNLSNYDSHIIDEKVYYYEQYGLFSPWRFTWPRIRPQSEVLPSKYFNLCGFVG